MADRLCPHALGAGSDIGHNELLDFGPEVQAVDLLYHLLDPRMSSELVVMIGS